MGSDHRAVSACFNRLAPTSSHRPKRRKNRCGKWLTDPAQVFSKSQHLCQTLDLSGRDLTPADLESLAAKTSYRPRSFRYKDTPEILDKIRQRRLLSGREARDLGKEIVRLRAVAKNLWLTEILDRSASGDCKAISYFRRRQAVLSSHQNYLVSAGGKDQAISDLKKHFRLKWCEPNVSTVSALDILHSLPRSLPSPRLITEEEVCEVLATCKSGKSCGDDGISYEFLQFLMQTECRVHFVEWFNSILFQTSPIPPSWLSSKLTLLPKVPQPSSPSDLRPIVLSSTPGKLFTKILLYRLRNIFPTPVANQLCGIPGSQTLDGSCCLQHLTHLSQEFGLPLIAVKLDIASAFDTLSHAAVARYLQHCGSSLESHALLSIIVATRVVVSISDATWTQPLERGILQGSSYSAEIFARTLDFYLGALVDKWSREESTWIQGEDANHTFRKIFTLLYADDLILLATSHAQATRMLQDVIATFGAIGLQLSLKKCKYICSPSLPRRSLYAQCTPLPCVSAFKFLGVLIGFNLTCQSVLSARLNKATNAFWGYYKILRRTTAPVKKRLDLFNTFITSRWRWMAPAVRPLKGIASMLKTLHTSFLCSILALPPDPFMTGVENWITRRRASRMAAQALHHASWEGIHALAFASYWGHVARIVLYRLSPISVVIRIRDSRWRSLACVNTKRRRGAWPDSCRLLQLMWTRFRPLGAPPLWDDAATDRKLWKAFVADWLADRKLQPHLYYPDLHHVDLHGRCLLQIGSTFRLLPMRHEPVESPYPSPYQFLPEPVDDDDLCCLQVCSDGSSRNRTGALGVAILPPYGDVAQCVVCAGRVLDDCTNIRAEVLAAVRAMKLILELRRYLDPALPIRYMTDSAFVLQILSEAITPTIYASDINELHYLWSRLCSSVIAVHVKGHAGHALNAVADAAAKQALQHGHTQLLYRTFNFDRAFFLGPCHPIPRIDTWLE